MHFFQDGGFTMVPILALGFLLVGTSGLDALRPAARFRAVVLSLAAVVASAGALGFVMAVVTTLRASLHSNETQERLTLIIAGVAESANNLVLALVFLVLAAVLSAVGAVRGRSLSA